MREERESVRRDDWEVRLLIRPDGVNQVVGLRRWFWETLQNLERYREVDAALLIEDCFKEAQGRQGDLAYAFSAVLERAILAVYHHLVEKPAKGYANDNHDVPYDPYMILRDAFVYGRK